MVGADVVGGGEVGVVGDVVGGDAQACAVAWQGDAAFDVRAGFFVEGVGEVPLEVSRPVAAHEGVWSCEMEGRGGVDAHGVAEHRDVQVERAVELQLSGAVARHIHLAGGVEMQRAALAFGELSADGDAALVPCGEGAVGLGQGVVFQLVCGEELDARLRPFVEAFEQRDADVVAQIGVAHAVVDGVGLEAVVVVEIVVCGRAVGCVCAAVVVEAYGVEE